MSKFLLVFSVVLMLTACTDKKKEPEVLKVSDKQELLEADRAFSLLSQEKGMKAAFVEYLDSNGILLRPNEMPIVGASAVDFLIRQNDADYNFGWKPNGAYIAQSGDLGFTYGVYEMRLKKSDEVFYGTYVTIWKRQQDGKWKFILDSGNSGVGLK